MRMSSTSRSPPGSFRVVRSVSASVGRFALSPFHRFAHVWSACACAGQQRGDAARAFTRVRNHVSSGGHAACMVLRSPSSDVCLGSPLSQSHIEPVVGARGVLLIGAAARGNSYPAQEISNLDPELLKTLGIHAFAERSTVKVPSSRNAARPSFRPLLDDPESEFL